MSNYRFDNPDGVYFVTFAVVDWVDVFTRSLYVDILLESIIYCQENKGLEVFAWCIMSNHVHLIIRRKEVDTLSDILRDLKKYTSKRIIEASSLKFPNLKCAKKDVVMRSILLRIRGIAVCNRTRPKGELAEK